MSLEKYTLQELQEEIWKRESEGFETSNEKEEFLCVGIVDNEGAESIILCDTKEKFAETIYSLQLRARFNSQRHTRIFCSKMPRMLFDAFDKRLKEAKSPEEYKVVGEAITELSNVKYLGY